jgi:hypothetical protein
VLFRAEDAEVVVTLPWDRFHPNEAVRIHEEQKQLKLAARAFSP